MPVNLKKIKKIREQHKNEKRDYEALIIVDDDVIFNLGGKMSDWKGVKTSVMVRDHDGRRVCAWLCRNDFDSDAQEIIQQQLDENIR